MKLAFCSSASTHGLPSKIAYQALQILEILPGVSIRKVLDKNWPQNIIQNNHHCLIGNAGKLSEDKSTSHFPLLSKHTGIAYQDMIFFDDSNWTNHCKLVRERCGVVTVRTPDGCQVEEWERGIEEWRKSRGGVKN